MSTEQAISVNGESVQPLGPGRAKVASSTTPGHWYDVDLASDQACGCRGYEIRRDCRHVKLVECWDGRWNEAQALADDGVQLQIDTQDATQGKPRGDEVKPFGLIETHGGYLCGELASALQKTIRRGLEREAMFFASELDLAGYGNYAWKRLRVITSEDVGLGDTHMAATIRALYENWQEERKQNKEPGTGMLYLMHAVLLLARAPKSRIVDNATNVLYVGDRFAVAMEIPDYAIDHHTARGRKMGRSEATVYNESYRLENQALPDPYEAEARAIDGAPPMPGSQG